MNDIPLQLGPAASFRHDHPAVRDVNREHRARMTLGQRVADHVATLVGSWPFILVQSGALVAWMVVNVYLVVMEHEHPGFLKAWDPYPFILLNLVLSFQAAYTGPVVMMSQNRQTEKDRLVAQSDYEINQKAEEEIEVIMQHLEHQDRLLLDAIRRIESIRPAPADAELAAKVDRILQRMEENDRRVLELLEGNSRPPAP